DPALPYVLAASRGRLGVDPAQPLQGNGAALFPEVAPGQRAACREELASHLPGENGGHEHLAVVKVMQQLEERSVCLWALLLGGWPPRQPLVEECVDPLLP